jgi:hypothetical protein
MDEERSPGGSEIKRYEPRDWEFAELFGGAGGCFAARFRLYTTRVTREQWCSYGY